MNAKEAVFWDNIYKDFDTEDAKLDPGSFCDAYFPERALHYQEKVFYNFIKGIEGKKILSLGGGIDKIALYLAKKDNQVTAIDISEEAISKTRILAERNGVKDKLLSRRLDWNETQVTEKFDYVITHGSLHHMDIEKTAKKIYNSLQRGGSYISLEPICLLGCIRFLHKRFPFHPYPFIEGETELTKGHLTLIRELFDDFKTYFFGFLTRESIFYFLYGGKRDRLVTALSKIDSILVNKLPFLKCLSSYVVFQAQKK